MTDAVEKGLRRMGITVSKPILAVICIIFGVLVKAFEYLLQWVVGLFLIIQRILLLTNYLELRKLASARKKHYSRLSKEYNL